MSYCGTGLDLRKIMFSFFNFKYDNMYIKNVSHLQFSAIFKIYLLVMRGCVEACDYKNYFRGRVSSPFSL